LVPCSDVEFVINTGRLVAGLNPDAADSFALDGVGGDVEKPEGVGYGQLDTIGIFFLRSDLT